MKYNKDQKTKENIFRMKKEKKIYKTVTHSNVI